MKKTWMSEGLLAAFVLGAVAVAASTSGFLHLLFVVLAIGSGLLLLWSLVILILAERVVLLFDRMKRSGDGDEPR